MFDSSNAFRNGITLAPITTQETDSKERPGSQPSPTRWWLGSSNFFSKIDHPFKSYSWFSETQTDTRTNHPHTIYVYTQKQFAWEFLSFHSINMLASLTHSVSFRVNKKRPGLANLKLKEVGSNSTSQDIAKEGWDEQSKLTWIN